MPFSCVESSWRLVGSVEVDRSVDIFFGGFFFGATKKTVGATKLTQKTQGILLILFFFGVGKLLLDFFELFFQNRKVQDVSLVPGTEMRRLF